MLTFIKHLLSEEAIYYEGFGFTVNPQILIDIEKQYKVRIIILLESIPLTMTPSFHFTKHYLVIMG